MAKTIHRQEYRRLIDLLRARREKIGMTQAGLAKALRWTQQKVSYVENGSRRIDVIEFIELARVLGLAPARALRVAELVMAK